MKSLGFFKKKLLYILQNVSSSEYIFKNSSNSISPHLKTEVLLRTLNSKKIPKIFWED